MNLKMQDMFCSTSSAVYNIQCAYHVSDSINMVTFTVVTQDIEECTWMMKA